VKTRKKMGRPSFPEGQAKSVLFSLRLSQTERDAIERAAEAAGENASEWARRTLLLTTSN
jgi:hypothetical protein